MRELDDARFPLCAKMQAHGRTQSSLAGADIAMLVGVCQSRWSRAWNARICWPAKCVRSSREGKAATRWRAETFQLVVVVGKPGQNNAYSRCEVGQSARPANFTAIFDAAPNHNRATCSATGDAERQAGGPAINNSRLGKYKSAMIRTFRFVDFGRTTGAVLGQ